MKWWQSLAMREEQELMLMCLSPCLENMASLPKFTWPASESPSDYLYNQKLKSCWSFVVVHWPKTLLLLLFFSFPTCSTEKKYFSLPLQTILCFLLFFFSAEILFYFWILLFLQLIKKLFLFVCYIGVVQLLRGPKRMCSGSEPTM